MKNYELSIPPSIYEKAKKICEEYFSNKESCVERILLLALEEGLRIVERKIKIDMLVPKEEKYDVEKFIADVKSAREGKKL